MEEQDAAAARKANSMLGCINKGITSIDKAVFAPLSACQPTPEMLCSFLVPTTLQRCGQAGEGPEKSHKEYLGLRSLT